MRDSEMDFTKEDLMTLSVGAKGEVGKTLLFEGGDTEIVEVSNVLRRKQGMP